MPEIRIEVDAKEITQALSRLMQKTSDLSEALSEIGEYLVASTRRRFAQGADPQGRPWAPLSPVTIRKKGHAKPLIGETGALRQIRYQIEGKATLAVGTGVVYGPTHQFGAKKGAFGKTQKGAPIPWGDIPARPFLGLSETDRKDILAILKEYLTDF